MHEWRERLRRAVENRAAVTYSKQGAIAHLAGITPSTLSHVLTGAHARPLFETVVRIAHASKESVGYLVGERIVSQHDEAALLMALYDLRDALLGVIATLETRISTDDLPTR